MMIFFWALLPLLAVNGQCKSWKQINIKVSKYDCWFEIEKVKVATMWKILSREMKPLQVIVTVLTLSCNKIVHNCFIAYELVYSSWFSSLSNLVGEPDSNLCPMSRSLECVQGGMETLRSPGATDQQMIKWPSDYMTQWPNEKKKADDKSDSDRKFPPGRSHPSDTWRLSPTWKNRSLRGRLLCHPVRCQVPQIIKNIQSTDLLTSGKGGVLTWSTFGRYFS